MQSRTCQLGSPSWAAKSLSDTSERALWRYAQDFLTFSSLCAFLVQTYFPGNWTNHWCQSFESIPRSRSKARLGVDEWGLSLRRQTSLCFLLFAATSLLYFSVPKIQTLALSSVPSDSNDSRCRCLLQFRQRTRFIWPSCAGLVIDASFIFFILEDFLLRHLVTFCLNWKTENLLWLLSFFHLSWMTFGLTTIAICFLTTHFLSLSLLSWPRSLLHWEPKS